MSPREPGALHNAFFAALSAGSGILLLALLVLAGKWLGEEAFGRFSWALALAVIFETLMDAGLKEVATRAVARDRSAASAYLSHTLAMKLVLGCVTVVLLGLTVTVLKPETDVRLAAVLLGIASALRSGMTTIRGVFYGVNRFDLETAVLVVDRFLLFVVGSLVLAAGYGPVALSFAFVASRAAAFLTAYWLAWRSIGSLTFSRDVRAWRDLQIEALPFGAFAIVLQLYNYIDTVLLGLLRTYTETSAYSAAYRIYEGFANVPSIIAVVLMPRLAHAYVVDRPKFARLARSGLVLTAAVGLPCTIGAVWLAPDIIRYLFGDKYPQAAPVLQLLTTGFVVVFPLVMLHVIAMASNAERLLLTTGVVGCLTNVSLNLVLIPRYGAFGSALATVLGETASLGLLGTLLWRRKPGAATAPRTPPESP
jgi:O-antigen/teichoic acid export membrane protein